MNPEVRNALNVIEAALEGKSPSAPVPGPGLPPPFIPSHSWWNPTEEEDAEWVALYGLNPEDIIPWTFTARGEVIRASSNSFPNLPALVIEGVTPDEILACAFSYAARGYGPDGVQRLKTRLAFDQARAKADAIAKTRTPQEAGALLPGAESMDHDTAAYGLMTGGGNLNSMSPKIGNGATVLEQIHWLLGTVSPGDPGPSGRP